MNIDNQDLRAFVFTFYADYDYKQIKKRKVIIAHKNLRWEIMKLDPENGPHEMYEAELEFQSLSE